MGPMIQEHPAWRRYVLIALVTAVAGVLLVLLALHGLLIRAGEYGTPAESLRFQLERGGLYRSAITDDVMSPEFRLERYRLLQPEVVALGSSRVLQFRQSHFERPFANLGMSIHFDQLPKIAAEMVAHPHRLKLAIVGIDHWQLDERKSTWNPGHRSGYEELKQAVFDARERYVVGPLRLVADGKLGLKAIRSILCLCDEGGPTGNRGLAALVDGSGVDAEGSYHYIWAFDHSGSPNGFDTHLRRISRRENGFEALQEASPRQVAYVRTAVETLEAAGVRVVLFIPPMPSAMVDAMRRESDFGVMDRLDPTFGRMGSAYFNFHDPTRRIQSPDCEFADGIHGGEVTYLRMLRVMAAENPDLWGKFVDRAKIDQMIADGAGRVNVSRHPVSGDRTRVEADFLGLGCNKQGR